MEMGFILGKLKVVLKYGYIIFRLEFCGVVFVVEIVEFIVIYLDFYIKDFIFYIDSKVVLGYI